MTTEANPALADAKVAEAVRAILEGEVDRVRHPGPRPDDREGWHPGGDPDSVGPGRPVFDPETWRYFELRDVAVIDGLILIAFGWTEPPTPPLTYLTISHPRPGSIHAAASSTRGALRALLRPGWRSRVERRWLDRDRVLIFPNRKRGSQHLEDEIAADLERRWAGGSANG